MDSAALEAAKYSVQSEQSQTDAEDTERRQLYSDFLVILEVVDLLFVEYIADRKARLSEITHENVQKLIDSLQPADDEVAVVPEPSEWLKLFKSRIVAAAQAGASQQLEAERGEEARDAEFAADLSESTARAEECEARLHLAEAKICEASQKAELAERMLRDVDARLKEETLKVHDLKELLKMSSDTAQNKTIEDSLREKGALDQKFHNEVEKERRIAELEDMLKASHHATELLRENLDEALKREESLRSRHPAATHSTKAETEAKDLILKNEALAAELQLLRAKVEEMNAVRFSQAKEIESLRLSVAEVQNLQNEVDGLRLQLIEKERELETIRIYNSSIAISVPSALSLASPLMSGCQAPPTTPLTRMSPDDPERCTNRSPGEQQQDENSPTSPPTPPASPMPLHPTPPPLQDHCRSARPTEKHYDIESMEAMVDSISAELGSEPIIVTCFHNRFDYVRKTTYKSGRAVVLAGHPSTFFNTLKAEVASTFQHDSLSIGYVNSSGKKVVIENNHDLLAFLRLVKRGTRPIFQCFNPEEEEAYLQRCCVGSSPVKLFAHPPSSTENTPSRVRSSLGERPGSAMSLNACPASMPYDYIAGCQLDDDTLEREFNTVSHNMPTVPKPEVVRYLQARYDSIGDNHRFSRLVDRLFRHRTSLTYNEFAIVMLRVSQS
jgi:hypothetical protein